MKKKIKNFSERLERLGAPAPRANRVTSLTNSAANVSGGAAQSVEQPNDKVVDLETLEKNLKSAEGKYEEGKNTVTNLRGQLDQLNANGSEIKKQIELAQKLLSAQKSVEKLLTAKNEAQNKFDNANYEETIRQYNESKGSASPEERALLVR